MVDGSAVLKGSVAIEPFAAVESLRFPVPNHPPPTNEGDSATLRGGAVTRAASAHPLAAPTLHTTKARYFRDVRTVLLQVEGVDSAEMPR